MLRRLPPLLRGDKNIFIDTFYQKRVCVMQNRQVPQAKRKKIMAKEAAKTKHIKSVNCQLPGAELLEQGKSVEEVMIELERNKHPGGRPRKFKNTEDMQAAINDYFESCFQIVEIKTGEGENQTIETKRVQMQAFTIAGMAYHLGFLDRGALSEYERRDDEFSPLIKRARLKIEAQVEGILLDPTARATGAIFWAKNHASYVDRQEVKHVDGGLAEALVSAHERLKRG